jgi:hypothetical protein
MTLRVGVLFCRTLADGIIQPGQTAVVTVFLRQDDSA